MSTITLKLTPYQAKTLWAIVDGSIDAGACEGGLKAAEAKALWRIMNKLMSQHASWNGTKADSNAKPGRICEHGVRWPWACDECDEDAIAAAERAE